MKKKVTLIVVAVFLIISLVVGISYAYWRLTYKGTLVNKIVSSCFSMELTNEKNNITLDSAYPISDEKGKSLTPYSFTITNTCDLFASYTINLEMLEGTTLNSKYVKTMINSEAITNLNTLETTDASIEAATESRVLFKGSLGSGDSVDYTLRLWMDSDTPFNEESMNKIFQAKITVTGEVSTYSPVENGFTNLADALLVNEYQTTSLDIAKDRIATKQSVDFSKTAPIIVWEESMSNTMSEFGITKPDSSLIGNYDVTDISTKVILSKSYSFNSETGYYTLVDYDFYDPETLDFENNTYYLIGGGINIGGDNNIISPSYSTGATMYKVDSLKRVAKTTTKLSSGTSVPLNTYYFNVYLMSETELESDKSDKGLYEALDDVGITYYYRGNVTNNYVKFAGYYWKTMRINGDGSVRLLYVGDTVNSLGTIGSSAVNSSKDNPTYVGYMYSNTLNASYEDTVRNDNNSLIKTTLDDWYKTNILDKGYENVVADAGFCNDRSLAADSVGHGATSSEDTFYSSRSRYYNNAPVFTCANSNDLFTLNGNNKGNGALTYPIGTITVDDLMFSGYSYGLLNKLSYTYESYAFWTMSPVNYRVYDTAAIGWVSTWTGTISDSYVHVAKNIRPVINLKGNTEIIGGIGTKNDPFIVK